MRKQLQTLKGFRDFLPKEAAQRAYLIDKIKTVFEKWGFAPLETPTLEPLEIFEGQIGEDEKLFFKFTDQGGRDVALRYDQTVPTCRVVSQYQGVLIFPFKRYQIQPAFRSEKPQKGRYREFLQCDADIFGVDSPLADAEMIALSLDIYREIGFSQAKVLINDRQLLKDIPYEAISSIDKIEKIGEDGVIKDMEKKGIEFKDAKKYLKIVRELRPNDTINTILEYLRSSGFDEGWFEFDPTIARSFSYSSGPIWEVKIPGFKTGSVLGGERFDGLVEEISGTKVPATGFGLGFDRTLEAAIQFGLIPNINPNAKVLISVLGIDYIKNVLQTARILRSNGINTEIFTEPDKKIGKQFKYADKKQIPYVIIIGEDEVKSGKVTLKDMNTGKQSLLSMKEVVNAVD